MFFTADVVTSVSKERQANVIDEIYFNKLHTYTT